MNPDLQASEPDERWKTIERLFLRALDFPNDDQNRFLQNACQGDRDLFNEVRALLKAHEKTGGLLDAFAAEQAAELMGGADSAPKQIGPYAILSELGEGGMGRVFHAKRDDGQFEREVALKVLRPGLADNTSIQRFLHERQILAKLQHPHIARLLDGGIDEHGQPFFAMDHIDGLQITDYCNANKSSIKKRIALFLDVCDAVQYAHRNLVVHRDLKPGNILVNTAGEVKLLDFGIARMLDGQSASDKTLTGIVALTPEYAAPEQVTGKPITTAVDVYTLGVIFYELLTGHRPYQLETRSLENIVHTVCEVEPQRMSTRFNQLADEQKIASANKRAQEAGALFRTLKGDLDAIAGKALQKRPEDRYASVEAMAQDLRRYLSDQPVLAHQGNWWYQSRKYVTRHKAGMAIAAILIASLGFQFASQKRQADRIAVERDVARLEAAKAEQIGLYLESIFAESDPNINLGQDVTARELLEAGAQRIENELASQPSVQAHMQRILGRVYGQLRLNRESEALLKKSLKQHQLLYGNSDSLVAAVHYDLAYALQRTTDRFNEAADHYRKALDIQKELFGEQHPATLNARIALSLLTHQLKPSGRDDSLTAGTLSMLVEDADLITNMPAEKQLQVAELFLYNQAANKTETICLNLIATLDSTDAKNQRWLIESHRTLGQLYALQGNHEVSVAHFEQSLALNTGLYGASHPDNTQLQLSLASGLARLKRYDEAIRIQYAALEEVRLRLGEHHNQVGESLMMLARIYYWARQYNESITYYRQALAIFRRTEKVSFNIPFLLKEISYPLVYTGQVEESERMLREARRHSIHIFGEDNQRTVQVNLELAKTLILLDKTAEALPLAEKGLKDRLGHYGPDHHYVGDAHLVIGSALTKLERFEPAESALLESIRIFDGADKPDPTWQAKARSVLKDLYKAWGKPDKAIP